MRQYAILIWCRDCYLYNYKAGCFGGKRVYLHEWEDDESLLFDTPEEAEEYFWEKYWDTIYDFEIKEIEEEGGEEIPS